jgi:outer membrane receptor protein involved in Fe transport
MDYRINDKHMINGMLWTGDYKATGMDHNIVNELFKSSIVLRTWTTVENWIWTPSSSVVNEARFGYNRAGQIFGVLDGGIVPDGSGGLCIATGCGGKGYPINTGEKSHTGLPNIDISGFGGGLGSWRGRPGGNTPNPYYDFQDSVSYLRGRHALKFGGEFAHIEADATPDYFRGRIQFRGKGTPGLTDAAGKPRASFPLEDFFAGNPNRALLNVGNGNRIVNWRNYAGFVQDDWRIKPRVMLNLGLRYEYKSPLKEANKLFGN